MEIPVVLIMNTSVVRSNWIELTSSAVSGLSSAACVLQIELRAFAPVVIWFPVACSGENEVLQAMIG